MKDPANYGQSSKYEKLERRVHDLEKALVQMKGYPRPIEEPIAPTSFEGPYCLNIYKPEHEEWFTSGIACSTDAMDTAKELSKNSKVIVRVRDKKGALVTEFKP